MPPSEKARWFPQRVQPYGVAIDLLRRSRGMAHVEVRGLGALPARCREVAMPSDLAFRRGE